MGHFFTFVFAILLVGLTILALVIVFVVRLLRSGANAGDREARQNEAKMIQELYHGFNRMEDRIETLETLLLDKERPQKPEDER